MKDTYKITVDVRDLLPTWFGMYRAKTVLVLKGELETSQIEQIQKWLTSTQRIQPAPSKLRQALQD